MYPNIMKWLLIMGYVALVAVAAPASLENAAGIQPTTDTQSRESLRKLPNIPSREVRQAIEEQKSINEPLTVKPITSTISYNKNEEQKRDTGSDESQSVEDVPKFLPTPVAETSSLATTIITKDTDRSVRQTSMTETTTDMSTSSTPESVTQDNIKGIKAKRETASRQISLDSDTSARVARQTGVDSGSNEYIPDARVARQTAVDSGSNEYFPDAPARVARQTAVDSGSNEYFPDAPARVARQTAVDSGSIEFFPDAPARVARQTDTQQTTEQTTTVIATTSTGNPKDVKRQTDDNVQKPTTLETTTQNKPAVSPPLVSNLPASRPSRDVLGFYQADRMPSAAVTSSTPPEQEQREKRDVESSENKPETKNNPALKRRLSTIPEEPSARMKRSAKAQGLEYRRPQPGGPGNNRPGFGNNRPQPRPGNNRPGGPGNNRPGGPGYNRPGSPGNNRPGGPGYNRPGSPGNNGRGGPGSYRPGPGSRRP